MLLVLFLYGCEGVFVEFGCYVGGCFSGVVVECGGEVGLVGICLFVGVLCLEVVLYFLLLL